MKKILSLLFLFIVMFSLSACSSNNKDESKTESTDAMKHSSMEERENSEGFSDVFSTKNVTRLDAENVIDAATKVSKTIWPSTHMENRPGAVILAPADKWQISLASADLIHHPNNGPVLFYENDEIPEAALKELDRLGPVGTKEGTEVIVMGNADQKVLDQLKDYQVEQIQEEDPAAFARDVDKKYAEASGELPNSLIIVSSDEEAKLYSLIAANWIAHMPEPILYVTKDGIPEATKEALSLRNNQARIYVLGPETVISKDVESTLKEFGTVTRIDGESPAAASIAFARFKDEKTGFGWGLTEPGHGLDFISTKNAAFAVAGAPFAHLGKHAPLIWLENGKLSNETHEFLGQLQPTFTDDPTVGPYNHAFIIGSGKAVSMDTQGMIDQMLEITSADGGGHGGH